MSLAFPSRALPRLPVIGGGEYEVARIFCVGRNYAAHAAEMGAAIPDAPFWFTKSAFALLPSDSTLPYPPATADLHHEVELVVALGAALYRADAAQARNAVWGHAVGLDMTRRDLQAVSKAGRLPWDTSKDWEGSAVIGALTRAAGPDATAVETGTITLTVNGQVRQSSPLGLMLTAVVPLLCHLSTMYRLGPGDIVMTGTPEGVAAVVPGDVLEGRLPGLEPVRLTIGPPQP